MSGVGGVSKAGAGEATAEEIRGRLSLLRKQSVQERLATLARAYPEIVRDAEWFMADARCMPWDFAVAFVEGQLLEIKEKYAVRPSHGRPAYQDVAPEVDLFFEACELIDERIRLENEAATEFLIDQDPRRNHRQAK